MYNKTEMFEMKTVDFDLVAFHQKHFEYFA
jgi:hypothetical protein